MRAFLHRHQPAPSRRAIGLAALGAFAAIGIAAALTAHGPWLLLIAPFGATCALLFAAPASPLAQPSAVIGGHALSTLIGLALRSVLPDVWWAVALAVACAIAAMMLARVLHPPGAADPILVFTLDPGFGFLIAPILIGAVLLVAVATAFHRLTGTTYPAPAPARARPEPVRAQAEPRG